MESNLTTVGTLPFIQYNGKLTITIPFPFSTTLPLLGFNFNSNVKKEPKKNSTINENPKTNQKQHNTITPIEKPSLPYKNNNINNNKKEQGVLVYSINKKISNQQEVVSDLNQIEDIVEEDETFYLDKEELELRTKKWNEYLAALRVKEKEKLEQEMKNKVFDKVSNLDHENQRKRERKSNTDGSNGKFKQRNTFHSILEIEKDKILQKKEFQNLYGERSSYIKELESKLNYSYDQRIDKIHPVFWPISSLRD
ncbi:gem-associated protein [Anaeramoeba flamelloides]|uniref:Gem-associated protein n=1 Tax=Anaeramoeba flamelloides TaxID=1746091 RepID=A0ABQ8XTV0_9EUKA|nr:gem-associated protein [Anaeramoeba flamelloides]